jgi:D-alanyl-D-alanine carboxypeptidase
MHPARQDGSDGQRLTGTMPAVDLARLGDGAVSRSVDRRTLLVGAAAALVAGGLSGPARAAGHAQSLAVRPGPRFDPGLARQLKRILHDAVRGPGRHAPGAILHVESPTLGAWTGVAGFGRVAPTVPMRAADRFRAGSIVKPFVAVRVLQLAERGRLSLDARLPEVLPVRVVGRFANAADISVRMLLGHRSGIPEWDTGLMDIVIAHHPAKVWTIDEKLDLAAAQPPVFAPGTSYSYSNTEYNLLGLIIEHVTGHSWRHELTRRVIRPLGLTRTYLPAARHRSIKGAHAHGYGELDGRRIDVTGVDPSMAGAAGGSALVTTVHDLTRFLNALLKRRLFRHPDTLRQMLAFAPAPDVGGQVGYGLGIEQRVFPGGVESIGHLGGTAGYFAYVARLRAQGVTIALLLNSDDDPTPLILPAVEALAATHP